MNNFDTLNEQAQLLMRAVKMNDETGALTPTHLRDIKAAIKSLQRQIVALSLEA